MVKQSRIQKEVIKHYDAVSENYHELYEKDKLYDLGSNYPANCFRLQLLMESFVQKKIKKVIEVGVGEGTPLVTLGKTGIEVWGFDISKKMVEKSKQKMKEHGMNPDHIFWGDIQNPETYTDTYQGGPFDGLIAMGVMPHIENDDMVIDNMSALVRPGGSVFIEFRNKLFSLFTFNRYTADFILNDLLKNVANEIKDVVSEELEKRVRMEEPPIRDKIDDSDVPGYDAILSKFHNPFEVIDLFSRHKFDETKLLWYHYHPAMPYLNERMPKLFRKEAIKMEHKSNDWRGFFLCSAFVVEAIKR